MTEREQSPPPVTPASETKIGVYSREELDDLCATGIPGLTLLNGPLEVYLTVREPDGDRELNGEECEALVMAFNALPAALERIRTLEERLAKREARLEIDHHFTSTASAPADMKRVEIPEAERDNWPDGIECRDETIRLLEGRIERLTTDLRHWRDEVGKLHSAKARADRADTDLRAVREALEKAAGWLHWAASARPGVTIAEGFALVFKAEQDARAALSSTAPKKEAGHAG